MLSTGLLLSACENYNTSDDAIPNTNSSSSGSSNSESSTNNPEVTDNVVNDVYKVSHGLINYVNSPLPFEAFDETVFNDETASPEELLVAYEKYNDLTPYYDYENMTIEEKLELHNNVMEPRSMVTFFDIGGTYSYDIDTSFIKINGDTATINGSGFIFTMDENATAEMTPEEKSSLASDGTSISPDFVLELKNTDNGWKVTTTDFGNFQGEVEIIEPEIILPNE